MLVMKEQVSIIITILSALLTGGFLMIFIESQHIANNIAERFHFRMRPFYYSFTNYVRFISFFKSCFDFRDINKDGYMKKLKDNLELIANLGGRSIVHGQEYPSDYFTAQQLESICNTINDIWYCIDKDPHGFEDIIFDTHHANNVSEHIIDYLEEVSHKYKGMKLTKDLLGKVSGDFYVNQE